MTTLLERPTPAGEIARPTPGALRPHVVGAIFRRNFLGYFSSPSGYVFITLFVLVSSYVAFCLPAFFANNLANLDTLNEYMPFLLLFFVPAITMGTWAEERRQGTDELLLTLPARDLEVVLGKYLAAVGIYTVALLFSISHVAILRSLGRPDPGVMASTYLGYWLMGSMLIAVGMVASIVSSNATVAFILGGLFCSIPVFAGLLGSGVNNPTVRRAVDVVSVSEQFRDFGSGVIPLSGVVYFVSIAGAMLYVNMILLGRRHWAGGERSRGLWAHALTRSIAVVVALGALTILTASFGSRIDASAEGLHTLSAESRALIAKIPKDRPVFIQAYYSPDVPREYVETRATLVNLLKQYAAVGGDKIRLNLVPTEPYSDQARDAQKRFGIEPKAVVSADESRQTASEVFLGVAFTSGLEEVVVPFFDPGLPIEYELTRSIRVVSSVARKKLGVLSTDAKLMPGMDFRSFNPTPEWAVVAELKKQYEVSQVDASGPITGNLDVLLVPQPSSLTQPQIDNLLAYIKKGGPTLLLMDPLPVFDPSLAPELPKPRAGGPFGQGAPPEQKGNLKPLLDAIGVEWPAEDVVWNSYVPHPQIEDLLQPEIVFIGPGSGTPDAFNPRQDATAGLQEVVAIMGGRLREKAGSGVDFSPLLKTGGMGGTETYREVEAALSNQSPLAGRKGLRGGTTEYVIAARLTTPKPVDPAKADPAKPKINVIAVADLDMISDVFFNLRRRGLGELKRQGVPNLVLDNVTFVLNCVDTLASDDAFLAIRKRRPAHRTLLTIEEQTRKLAETVQRDREAAEAEAAKQLSDAQTKLNKDVDLLVADKSMDNATKEARLLYLRKVANDRLEVERVNIENQKRRAIQESRTVKEQQTRSIRNGTSLVALTIPPLFPALLGLVVFGLRSGRENRGASPSRMA